MDNSEENEMIQNNKQMDWNLFYKKTLENYKDLLYLVLNEKNRLITKAYIKNMLMEYLKINYTPNNINIFEIAMTHTSYIKKDYSNLKNFKTIFTNINVVNGETIEPVKSLNEVISLKTESYERLEFVGDTILKCIISDYLFSRYSEMGAGGLSDLRAQIENKKSFSKICTKLSLHKYVLLSKCHEINCLRDKSEKVQCDIFEAFIAALYYDICNIAYEDIGNINDLINVDRSNAFKICYMLVVKLIETELDLTILLENDTNYKNMLSKHYHVLNWPTPIYSVIETIQDKNQNKKQYKCGVYDNNKTIIGAGICSSKNDAEKISAKNALYFLKVIQNIEDDVIEINDNDDIIYK
jgi:ribonuclease-3